VHQGKTIKQGKRLFGAKLHSGKTARRRQSSAPPWGSLFHRNFRMEILNMSAATLTPQKNKEFS